jgi:hypothetical protein
MFIGTFGRVATDLLALALEYGYQLGSVEQVPLDAQHGWKRDGTIAAGDVPESPRAPTFTPTRAGRGSRLCDGRPGRDITVRLTQQITPALSGCPPRLRAPAATSTSKNCWRIWRPTRAVPASAVSGPAGLCPGPGGP